MKPEEIDIFKDLKITLESTIEKLEKISIRKEPREWWVVEYASGTGELVYDNGMPISKIASIYNKYNDVEKVYRVREVVE